MMKNIQLHLAYDGTPFLGWQKTAMGRSVEEEVEKALHMILQHEVTLQAASRTDSGVHALGQVVNFFTDAPIMERFLDHLNHLLPKEIRALFVIEREKTFHPTLDVMGKTYRYELNNAPALMPHLRSHHWHYPYPLDLVKMQKATLQFIGKRDFGPLCNEPPAIREIYAIDIESDAPNHFSFSITGNHFLYKMVRILVGTLVYIGRGLISLEEIPSVFRDRKKAGITAPACGLFLEKVHYLTLVDPSSTLKKWKRFPF